MYVVNESSSIGPSFFCPKGKGSGGGGGGMWQKLSMRVGMCKLEVFQVEASD